MKHVTRLSVAERQILRFSICVRVACILLALLTSFWVTPFDDSGASALGHGHDAGRDQSGKKLLRRLALPFTQWDAIHFLSIARHGYIHEQNFAFLPGAPGLLALGGRLPFWLGISKECFSNASAVLSVSLLATCLSIWTPVIFYRLTVTLTQNTRFAKTSGLLYVLAPAPAILSVPYTEPFYAFFAFNAMYSLARREGSYWTSTLHFTVAGSFRANGVLNAGFILWHLLWKPNRLSSNQVFRRGVRTVVLSAVISLPFLAHQALGYSTFCLATTTSEVTSKSSWCKQALPSIYAYVQEQYWDVGFLRYWTVSQIPNFALASPVLAMSLAASLIFYDRTWPACFIQSLPATFINSDPPQDAPNNSSQSAFLRMDLLPYVHLSTLLTLVLFFASHVQIALRQACTNPVIFWFAADLIERGNPWGRRWVKYCVVWGAISVILWTSFYPPA